MHRLSIIIVAPETGRESNAHVALEETLVSVLENAPPHSEVLLACGASYDDPYDLADEVRFVREEASSSWTTLANAALLQSRGRFVHLLMPGMRVEANWQQDACDFLSRCSDSIVGVSPRLEYDSGEPSTIGVCFTASGRRQYLDTTSDASLPMAVEKAFGPCRQASFFRRTDLIQAGGWNEDIQLDAADIELALRLRSQGFEFAHRADSVVHGSALPGEMVPAGRYGLSRDLERIYRTYQAHGVLPRRGFFAKLGRVFSSDSMLGRWSGGFGMLPMSAALVASAASDSNETAADTFSSESRSRAA